MAHDRIAAGSVLYITRKWPPAVGGMETYSVRLTSELAKRIPLETIALPGRGDRLPPTGASLLLFALKAARLYLSRRRPTAILHIGDLASWPLALLRWLRSPRAAVVLSAHGTDASYPRRGGWKGKLYGSYLRVGARLHRGARVIANSAATADAAAEAGWRNISVVPLATELSAPEPPSVPGRHLLFAGRLIEQKGCSWFIREVLPLLPASMTLKVAGPVWDRREEGALNHPRVEYLGVLGQDALVNEYRQAACVLAPNIKLPSGEFEGFGLVAVEAAAVGGLVLASATGGLIEAVEDGTTGFLVAPGDPRAWTAKIIEVTGWTDQFRRQFLAGSMERSKRVHCWERVADDVLSAYEKAAGEFGAKAPAGPKQ